MTPFPTYVPPDFTRPDLAAAPPVRVAEAPGNGVLPAGFHATSNYPEYVHLGGGRWLLASGSRMDAVLVLDGDMLRVVEPRLVRRGDRVVVGRTENGEEGIYVHTTGFDAPAGAGETSSPSAAAAPGRAPFPAPMTSCTTSCATTGTTATSSGSSGPPWRSTGTAAPPWPA